LTQEAKIKVLRVLKNYDIESDSLSKLIYVYRYLQGENVECDQLHKAIESKRDADYEDAAEYLEDAIEYIERL